MSERMKRGPGSPVPHRDENAKRRKEEEVKEEPPPLESDSDSGHDSEEDEIVQQGAHKLKRVSHD